MKVVVHSAQPFDTEVMNPLGEDCVPHRMWTWADGSWVLVRFYDDGAVRTTTSGLQATVEGKGSTIHLRVRAANTRPALRSTPTAENEAR